MNYEITVQELAAFVVFILWVTIACVMQPLRKVRNE